MELLSTAQVIQVASPYLRGVLSQSSREGRKAWRARRRGAALWTLGLAMRQVAGLTQESRQPEQHYSDAYRMSVDSFDAHLASTERAHLFKLGTECLLLLPPAGLYSVYLANLAKIIAELKPASVCELGFGSGKNLIYLAPRFPEIKFSGYEMTTTGVTFARSLQERAVLPSHLAELVGRSDEAAMGAIRRIEFHQANAKQLPLADKSVDLTFTVLALEQMWSILPAALQEIHRVTTHHVVFLEAFQEVNDYLGYLNLWSRNYFRANLAQIQSAGFRPLELLREIPNKHTFSCAILIAEVLHV